MKNLVEEYEGKIHMEHEENALDLHGETCSWTLEQMRINATIVCWNM